MAKTPQKGESKTVSEALEETHLVDETEHPDFVAGHVGEDAMDATDLFGTAFDEFEDGASSDGSFTPVPGSNPSLPGIPGNPRLPIPTIPRPPILNFCGPVSGRYKHTPPVRFKGPIIPQPSLPGRPTIPVPTRPPMLPVNLLNITVRVDVDRFFPQKRISIEWSRLFPNQKAHVIGEVTSDRCTGYNTRTVEANIIYRNGSPTALQGSKITFKARRVSGLNYQQYSITLSGGGAPTRTYALSFQSTKFDDVEFEVDRVANAGAIHTSYATGDHPNRPGNLPSETISLGTVFERAGFDVTMSPNTTVIPTSGAGSNGTWSDSEMHNAMQTYWSRFSNRPQWAMWVLYAARHDSGRGLGGVMFDDIGPNHRQGTAIFTDSFINDVPNGDGDPAGWRRRMQFWTAVHEMGHAFNLAHSWQKALGTPQGAPGDPWIPLANEPDARSFMNYPFNVSGGESSFFSDFRFRFSDDELIFMRHAPRNFVQMGNSNWFENHGFEAPNSLQHTGNWALELRPNRDASSYRFLEPVTMELKLTNTSAQAVSVDPDMVSEGHHVTIFTQKEGGKTHQWRPMMASCHEPHEERLDPGESLYGAHMVSAASSGWIIDEPGFYKVQAAVNMGDEIIVSNVARVYVTPPVSADEAAVAGDYFTEDVARAIAFKGAPELTKAHSVLDEVIDRCGDHPAVIHAKVARSAPQLRDYKILDVGSGRDQLAIKSVSSKVSQAAKTHENAFFDQADVAADTMGHIPYFDQCREVAEALEDNGAGDEAVNMMEKTIAMMKKRGVLASVIDNAERRLKRRK